MPKKFWIIKNILDLGIRVTGGKRLPNGDLSAFITDVNPTTNLNETLGEIKEGIFLNHF